MRSINSEDGDETSSSLSNAVANYNHYYAIISYEQLSLPKSSVFVSLTIDLPTTIADTTFLLFVCVSFTTQIV